MNSNITTQFLTEHLLTLQDFLQVFKFVPQFVQESDTYQSYGVN
jgi:hypothetical protein